jgi:DNA-binding CsgD family transcriptional regulator
VRALADRSRALILAERGDTATALGILRRIATEAFHDEPFQRGRTLLVLGEVARRDRKIGEARRAFTLAAQQFEHLGAALWAAKARREEARLAGRHPGGGLTETDREITRLVAAGRTNREIADALFMSSHTVDSHLRRIFLALDVHSRTELVARLGPGGWEGTLAADAGR